MYICYWKGKHGLFCELHDLRVFEKCLIGTMYLLDLIALQATKRAESLRVPTRRLQTMDIYLARVEFLDLHQHLDAVIL